MPVVSVDEEGQVVGALCGVEIGARIGPFSQGCLDEALGLAIGPGCIGLGADMLEAELAASLGEGLGSVA